MNLFTIKCKTCGSEEVGVWDWHNDEDGGKRLKCRKCKAKEDI